ncbi:unnamed protein product [Brachionus calyciflorus]|uniref:Snake toxin/toxin-like domain-containing protein n=1 Tax=Brachionus calyciflorus TaxID=104777 RepID=A0A813W6N6_9BILA|nr:unnamed protein product [Brachionus calyciflorus]
MQKKKILSFNYQATFKKSTFRRPLNTDSVALKCYACDQCSSVNVGQLTNCSSTESFCSKTKGSVSGVEMITRKCTDACTSGSVTFLGITVDSYCCRTDGCNFSTKMVANIQILLLSILSFIFIRA